MMVQESLKASDEDYELVHIFLHDFVEEIFQTFMPEDED
jgi:hypothetical protein